MKTEVFLLRKVGQVSAPYLRYLWIRKCDGISMVNQCMAELEFPLTSPAVAKTERGKGRAARGDRPLLSRRNSARTRSDGQLLGS